METRTRSLLLTAVSCLALSAGTALAESNTWWVDVNGTSPGSGTEIDPFTSIHYAVHHAGVVDGDTILVRPGIYEETVEIVSKYVTVRSTEGAGSTTVDALGVAPAFIVIGDTSDDVPLEVLIEGFTITGGASPTGGGLRVRDIAAVIRDCVITGNRAERGGGLAVSGGHVHVYDTEIVQNRAETELEARDGLGGGIYSGKLGGVFLTGVGVRGNVAGIGGGIYSTWAQLELTGANVVGNLAHGESYEGEAAEGGGIYAFSSDVRIRESRIGENLAWGPFTRGGGLRFCGETEAWVSKTLIEGNAAGAWKGEPQSWMAWGGGIASDVGLTAEELEVRGNHATFGGGGVSGSGRYTNTLFVDNRAHRGGGIYVEVAEDCFLGQLEVYDSILRENVAFARELPGQGGGVAGPAFVKDTRIVHNQAFGNGGGSAGATLIDTEVYGNRATPGLPGGPPAWGAGVYTGYVEGSVLRDNVAQGVGDILTYGGGAALAMLRLTQVFDNEALIGGGAANCDMDRCTVYANTAERDCGGLYFGESRYVTSSIVWANHPHQVVDELGVTIDYSTVQHGWAGAGKGNGSTIPLFWDPDVRDFHLKPSSPCIDMGDPLVQDPDGSRCDQGALCYDAGYCGMPSTYCEAKMSSLGCAPVIGTTGTPSLTGADDFYITARNLPSRTNGLMIWGHFGSDQPFHGGTLCVQGPLTRTAVQSSGGSQGTKDCSGTLSFLFSQSYMGDHFLWHGRTIYAQFLHRDPGFGAPKTVGMTEGLRVTICP